MRALALALVGAAVEGGRDGVVFVEAASSSSLSSEAAATSMGGAAVSLFSLAGTARPTAAVADVVSSVGASWLGDEMVLELPRVEGSSPEVGFDSIKKVRSCY